jgi:hypothetical protein
MQTKQRTRWVAVGVAFGAGIATIIVSALGAFAGSGHAASAVAPENTTPPSISGTPQEGSTLSGNRGQWANSPTSFADIWLRCDKNGGSCANINGATGRSYKLTPARPSGCPPTGNPDQVSQMSLPAKLIVDQFQPQPSTLNASTQSFALRVHVTSTCGGPVQGALVYGTPTPFNQFDETQSNTGSDGWATLNFSRQANYPVNGKQQILAMFLRASKPGENVLAGITGYRLVNVPVNL